MAPTGAHSASCEWPKRPDEAPPSVILADGDSDLRMRMATALRRDGFEVIEARDGAELIDRISDWTVHRWPRARLDLIVSEVRLPVFLGTEVITGLRRSQWNTPVILTTTYDGPTLREQAHALGVASIFTKPFDLDDLRTAALNTVLAARRHSGSMRKR
jgi:CheY-like chemotaxis protein